MSREKLEAILDSLFALHLTSRQFLERCLRAASTSDSKKAFAGRIQRLRDEENRLRDKRTRVLDTFLEGVIEKAERDQRLSVINTEIQATRAVLTRELPQSGLDLDRLVHEFAPLVEWRYWTRDQKRSVLSAVVPDIRVADYAVESLGLPRGLFSNDDTRSPAVFTTIARTSATARRR